MVDDFWGEDERDNFLEQMKRVFPEAQYEPAELPLDHEIFRCVYRLKEKPQVPSIHHWGWNGGHLGRPRPRLRNGPLHGNQRRQGPA